MKLNKRKGWRVEHGNLDRPIYRFDGKHYSFFIGAFNPAKANSKLWNESTQSINEAGTLRFWRLLKILAISKLYCLFFFF